MFTTTWLGPAFENMANTADSAVTPHCRGSRVYTRHGPVLSKWLIAHTKITPYYRRKTRICRTESVREIRMLNTSILGLVCLGVSGLSVRAVLPNPISSKQDAALTTERPKNVSRHQNMPADRGKHLLADASPRDAFGDTCTPESAEQTLSIPAWGFQNNY